MSIFGWFSAREVILEIRQLRHFIAAAEAGNLRKASENIHISHPALSMSIKNLESDLGVMLLDKNRRGVQLTYAGQVFLKSAQVILRQIDDVRALVKGSENSPTGNVRLGIPFGVNNAIAAPLCQLLMERYPGINLEIEEGSSLSLGRLYEDNQLDLLIAYDVVEKMDQRVEQLYVEHLYLLTAYNEQNEVNQEIDPSELNGVSLACSPGAFSMRRSIDKYAFDNKIKFNFVLDFQSAHASLKIVQAGLADAIASWDLIHDHVEAKLVSAKRIVNPPLERSVCLVSSLRNRQTAATAAIISAIKVAIEEAKLLNKIRDTSIETTSETDIQI